MFCSSVSIVNFEDVIAGWVLSTIPIEDTLDEYFDYFHFIMFIM